MQELPKLLKKKERAILIPHKEDYFNISFKQIRASEHVIRNKARRLRNNMLRGLKANQEE